MDKVIVLKDWVPGWARDSYMTQEEIDTFNEEYRQSQLEPSNTPTSSDNPTVLVGEAVAKLESID